MASDPLWELLGKQRAACDYSFFGKECAARPDVQAPLKWWFGLVVGGWGFESLVPAEVITVVCHPPKHLFPPDSEAEIPVKAEARNQEPLVCHVSKATSFLFAEDLVDSLVALPLLRVFHGAGCPQRDDRRVNLQGLSTCAQCGWKLRNSFPTSGFSIQPLIIIKVKLSAGEQKATELPWHRKVSSVNPRSSLRSTTMNSCCKTC